MHANKNDTQVYYSFTTTGPPNKEEMISTDPEAKEESNQGLQTCDYGIQTDEM